MQSSSTGIHLRCMHAGARQATRLRRRYLQAVLRQDAAFFDASAKSGVLLQGLNEDTSAIQLAIGEKVLLLSHRLPQASQFCLSRLLLARVYCSTKISEAAWRHVQKRSTCTGAKTHVCICLQAGNFLDKIVTFCVGMGIGKGCAFSTIRSRRCRHVSTNMTVEADL